MNLFTLTNSVFLFLNNRDEIVRLIYLKNDELIATLLITSENDLYLTKCQVPNVFLHGVLFFLK